MTQPGAPGTYFIATVDGRDVAAVAPSTGLPVAWQTYMAVDDLEAAASSVMAHGGRLLAEPAEVGPAGCLASVCRWRGGCIPPLAGAGAPWRAACERPGHLELLASVYSRSGPAPVARTVVRVAASD